MDPSLLRINLLGGFLLAEQAGLITTLHKPRLQELLAYLILHRDAPQPRRQVAFALWPDSEETQALTNLRNLAYKLRHALPRADQLLCIEGPTLRWRPEASVILDVAEFEQGIARAEQALRQGDRIAARTALEAAVALYHGDLLPDCYDEWILPERERLRQLFTAALEQLVVLLEEQYAYPAAIRYAQRWLQAEPLHEVVYLQLMRLYALTGDRAAALYTYQTCVTTLRRELATDPGQALHDAYARLVKLEAGSDPAGERAFATTLVGRQPEWRRLLACWHNAVAGHPHCVMLSGEAGIGKTRLAEELLHWAGQQGFTTAFATCYAAEGELIYSPIVNWLRTPAIRQSLSALDPVWLVEVARLVPDVRIARTELPLPDPQAEAVQRPRLFEALVRAVMAAAQPLLLIIDDLQRCDRTTLEWLRYLLHAEPRARLLLLGAFRREDVDATHPLMDLLAALREKDQITEIALDRLDMDATAALAAQLAGHTICPEQASALYHETEGNPLFVVEMMRAKPRGQHARAYGEPLSMHPVGAVALPPRIYAVIAARLAKLSPPAAELVGLAATIGRSFSFDLLRRAGAFDDDALVRGLDELWHHWIIREQGEQRYDFSHAKLREVAYARLSEAWRHRWHVRIAEALDGLIGNQPDLLYAQVAAHFARGGCAERAIRAYQRAAETAQQLYAFAEAATLYQRALELRAHARPDPVHPKAIAERERPLQEGLGHSLARAEQHAEARHAYAGALALTPEADVLARARLHREVGNSWRAQGILDQAEEAYARALRSLSELRQQPEDTPYWQELIALHFDQMNACMWRGYSEARIAEQFIQLERLLEQHGSPPQIAHTAHLALVAEWWRCSGNVDNTYIDRSERALRLCETCGDRWLAARARSNIGMMHILHGDAGRADELLQLALVDTEQVGDV
jgi:DNA-binding SARP family transcriptional activator